jgi:hypothetical protein
LIRWLTADIDPKHKLPDRLAAFDAAWPRRKQLTSGQRSHLEQLEPDLAAEILLAGGKVSTHLVEYTVSKSGKLCRSLPT